MRDAESLFSQIASTGDKQISKEDVLSSLRIANRNEENLFLEELLSKNSIAALAVFDRLVNQGIDSFMLSHRFLEKLRRILLLKINSSAEDLLAAELDEAEISKIKKLAGSATISDILNLTMRFLQAQPLIKNSSLPYLPLELSIVEFCAPKETGSPTPAKDLEPKQKKSGTKVMAESKEKKEVKKIKKIKKSSTENKSPEKKVEKEEDEDIQETKKPIADLSAVMSSWPKILEKMKDLQPALLSILRVSSPVKIEDETLIISTPFKFHQEKLNEAKNRAIFCAELKTATGIEKICVLEDKAVKVEPKKEEELVDQVKNLLNL
jgi:DNA polymerase-3 subunit gamma/tau